MMPFVLVGIGVILAAFGVIVVNRTDTPDVAAIGGLFICGVLIFGIFLVAR